MNLVACKTPTTGFKLQIHPLVTFAFAFTLVLTTSTSLAKAERTVTVALEGFYTVMLHDVTLEYSPLRGLPTGKGIEVQIDGRKVFVPWSRVESLTFNNNATPPHWRVKLEDGRVFPDYGSLHADTEFVGEVSIEGTGPYGDMQSYFLSPQDPSSWDFFNKIMVNF